MDASFCAAAAAASMLKSSPRPPPSPPFCHRIDMPEHSTTPKTTNIKRKASSALVTGNDDAAADNSSNNSSNQSLCSDGSTLSSSNSSTSSSSSGSGSLDCQSLQRNLKRIRLSSSPGELRLQLDLRQLAQEDWIQTSEEHWKCLSNGSTLERCHADPLRLVLRMRSSGHIHNNSNFDNMEDVEDVSDINIHNSNHTTCTNHQYLSIAVWLQIPRHYPHRPPVITRICYYDELSSTSAGPMMMIMRSPNNVAASASSSQSLLQQQQQQHQEQQQYTFAAPPPQRIQSILITADSMNDSSFAHYNNNSTNVGSMPMAEQRGHSSANTAVYTGWNPVQRLSDVLQFIFNTLILNINNDRTTTTCAGQSTASELECCTSTTSRQEEPVSMKMVAAAAESRLNYEQQQQYILEATDATEKSRFLATQPSHFHHHSAAPSVGSDNIHPGQLLGHRRVAVTREENNAFETRMEDADYNTDLERTFPPNRFDLGYERHLGMDE